MMHTSAEAAQQTIIEALDFATQTRECFYEAELHHLLGRMWQSQGQTKDAHDLLTPVYDWFTEGFDT